MKRGMPVSGLRGMTTASSSGELAEDADLVAATDGAVVESSSDVASVFFTDLAMVDSLLLRAVWFVI